MDTTTTWFDLDDRGGVIELHERITPPGLALELHVREEPHGIAAAWVLEDGRLLRWAEVGEA